jgi:hypothetical protein
MALAFASNKLIESANMTANFQSDWINLHCKKGFSIHAIFTGSPTGYCYIAVAIDNGNPIVLADSTQSISASGDIFYNVDVSQYLSARLHYVFTSGSGTLNAFYNAKGDN